MEKFTDKVDVDTNTSLYEYGFIRNPKTNKCVVCTNLHELDVSFGDLMEDSIRPKVRVFYLGYDAVKEVLEEAEDGYFDFIGSGKEKELEYLNNEHLANTITSLEAYNGAFGLY